MPAATSSTANSTQKALKCRKPESPRATSANARVPPHSGKGRPVSARNGHGGIRCEPSRETSAPPTNGRHPATTRPIPSLFARIGSSLTARGPTGEGPLMRRLLLAATLTFALAAAPAHAQVFGPPSGKVFTGLTGSNLVTKFSGEVGKRPAVFGFFTYWNASNEYTFNYARKAHARLMLHISTAQNYGVPEVISPLGIARGQGDGYLLSLNARIAEAGEPVYVRLMAEMN